MMRACVQCLSLCMRWLCIPCFAALASVCHSLYAAACDCACACVQCRGLDPLLDIPEDIQAAAEQLVQEVIQQVYGPFFNGEVRGAARALPEWNPGACDAYIWHVMHFVGKWYSGCWSTCIRCLL